ncbi:hypothetical protein [Evtepia gabavorous]|uniref:hypothetical protein n=1 Tax=Evtepia gabavorous TaxID=2211183 RepID=UPI003A913C46
MKKPGRKLQKRTMGLLRNLMILGVSFVGLTVVLQLEIEYNLLVLIYALSAVAVLLYQLIRNRSDRDKLDQEVARSNFLMNAALPGGDVRLFELLPDGMIRVLSPGKGQGGQLKTTLETPRRLLSYLNCSAQWEAPPLPGRPGAGRPGPGQRSGVPDHGPGGNLDSAADGAPARQ